MSIELLKSKIRVIENWPMEWISFKDITPLLQDEESFRMTIDKMTERYDQIKIDKIVWVDSRWFLFAWAMAYKLWSWLVIARKPWKLPYKAHSESYDLEYWSNTLELHIDSILPWENVVIVDDVLATWWTALACANLVKKAWWNIISIDFLIELAFLDWRKKLDWITINSLLHYE